MCMFTCSHNDHNRQTDPITVTREQSLSITSLLLQSLLPGLEYTYTPGPRPYALDMMPI